MLTREFVLSGDATFSVETPDTYRLAQAQLGREFHERYTFRVTRREFDGGRRVFYFVHSVTEAGKCVYLGILEPVTARLRLTDRSAFPATATRVMVATRVLTRLMRNESAAIVAAGWTLRKEAAPAVAV